jgi:tRNA(adenine34) deaminase
MMHSTDEHWMGIAIEAAVAAEAINEVPIGACVVADDGKLLAVASNRTISDNDPTAHAEILAIRAAAKRIGNYRLLRTTLYSTVEPCVMCAGALVNARISRLVYGTADERYGGVVTRFRLCDSEVLNHQIEIHGGVRAEECQVLMLDFFRARR